MMETPIGRESGALALVVGGAAACSAVSLGAMFAVGQPFGTINDIGNAATGVLSAVLAWRLRGHLSGRTRDVALGAALAGAAITVVGSGLVVSGRTGFMLAGLVSSVGFAGIGTWALLVNRSAAADAWPRRLRSLGQLAGGLMAVGILAAPGVALRIDDMATAPGWVWLSFLGWLGTFVLYPAWALMLGVTQSRPAMSEAPVGEAAV